MNVRGPSSIEQEENARLRKLLQRERQKVASLELEIQRLRRNRGRGNHRQEGLEDYLGQPPVLVSDDQRSEGLIAEYPVEEFQLPNFEDEEFTWNGVLLYGGEEAEKNMPEETWEKDTLHQEEDIEKRERSEAANDDEGCCMFCRRTIISEGDESEHYRHCPEYNRWSGSENNSFYSLQ